MSDIVILKLLSGEELLAKKESEGFYDKPRMLHMVQTQDGVRAGLVPWLLSNPDAEVKISQHAIVAELVCPSDLESSYLQQTSRLDLSTKL